MTRDPFSGAFGGALGGAFGEQPTWFALWKNHPSGWRFNGWLWAEPTHMELMAHHIHMVAMSRGKREDEYIIAASGSNRIVGPMAKW